MIQHAIPSWFADAVAYEPVRSSCVVAGAAIELLTWGEVGKPGLLFVHGSAAHADWWSFIAPSFAEQWRVAAISWSGMGRSGWRDSYSYPIYREELWTAIEAAGLHQASVKPIVVAHSFGGVPALQAGLQHPRRLRGIAFIDCRLRTRTLVQPGEHQPARLYASEQAILERFRFTPPDTGAHPYIRDFIGRRSIKQVMAPQAGWTWCFDPERRNKMQPYNQQEGAGQLQIPMVLIAGGSSTIVTTEQRELFRRSAPNLRQVLIPDAGHHIMVDQPLALIDALHAVFAAWNA